MRIHWRHSHFGSKILGNLHHTERANLSGCEYTYANVKSTILIICRIQLWYKMPIVLQPLQPSISRTLSSSLMDTQSQLNSNCPLPLPQGPGNHHATVYTSAHPKYLLQADSCSLWLFVPDLFHLARSLQGSYVCNRCQNCLPS